jgi:hypothetical protein
MFDGLDIPLDYQCDVSLAGALDTAWEYIYTVYMGDRFQACSPTIGRECLDLSPTLSEDI